MTRREAREHCFKMLFCQDFYPAEEKEEQLERYFDAPVEDVTGKDGADEVLHQVDLEGADKTALEARVEAIMKKIPELDEKINGVAEGWKTRRMGRVELTILRLALFEMKEDQEIPEKVAINEAVELAKKFRRRRGPGLCQRDPGEAGGRKIRIKSRPESSYGGSIFSHAGEFVYQKYVCPGLPSSPALGEGGSFQL